MINVMSYRHIFVSLLLAVVSLTATAESATIPSSPSITKGEGDACVEEVSYMRKNHMELLNHQRDDTMHKGIRTKKHSLNNCVSCHAKKDDKGQYIAINAEKQFCQSCHTYAGVSIDCFQCHATKPAKKIHHHSLTNPQAIPQGDDVKTSQLLNNLVTH